MIRHCCIYITIIFTLAAGNASALEAPELFDALRNKVLSVHDYSAQVKMKINVNYMRIPPLSGILYYKSPDKMKLERHGGLSILPKKHMSLTLSNLIPNGDVLAIDAGTDTIDGVAVRIIKVIPTVDEGGIVLTKIWVDERKLVALRTETTTRDEGTVIMDLRYNKYIAYALPDHVTIHMDIKEYKLPKGVTMDYNDLPEAKDIKKVKNKKGTIDINYLSYEINKGISDNIFAEK